VEVLRSDPFIPNDICLGGDGGDRCKIITGPNMGGKSSATRMVAIIAVMAQLGSFVPADSLTIGMLDGIMTRMGGEPFEYECRCPY
jgi:DNA mismatch repair protein MSH3